MRCTYVIAGVLGRAGEAGKNKRLKVAEEGKITYTPDETLTKPRREEVAKAKSKVETRAEEVEDEGSSNSLTM